MCARLLACPLCSQPVFLSLDALRAGLVSVSTRPLACPVCNEVLLGIEKLTIHLFGHTIEQSSKSAKIIEVTNNSGNVQAIVRSAPVQTWNVLGNGQATEAANHREDNVVERTTSNIFIPIEEIETFRNLTTLKDAGNIIPADSGQEVAANLNASSQVIFVQDITSQSNIFTANVIGQSVEQQSVTDGVFQAPSTITLTSMNAEPTQIDQICSPDSNEKENAATASTKDVDVNSDQASYQQNSTEINTKSKSPPSENFPPSHTDRLAQLVKNAQITSSPLGSFHDSYDCSSPEKPAQPTSAKAIIKSTRILSASEKTERCNVCGFHFPDRNILMLHKQLVHMVKSKDPNAAPDHTAKSYPCNSCTKVFKKKGSLMIHMRFAHSGINPAVSPKEHTQQSEPTKEPPPKKADGNETDGYNCPTCGKNFKKEQHVTQHLKIHDGKQWECEICSKMFTTKYFLKKHKRLHSGEMPYKCSICDKTFTFQQSYHKHRLYHKDDKPHSCTVCGRSFKELSTLHNHERIHTGEKPFACETCGTMITSTPDLPFAFLLFFTKDCALRLVFGPY